MRQSVKLWLEALESGEWKQTRRCLENEEGNCCLGVLCRIYEKEFSGELKIAVDPAGRVRFDAEASVLPEKVRDWIGLNDDAGAFGVNSSLLYENDNGKTFKQIAQIIRDNAKDLFVDGKL